MGREAEVTLLLLAQSIPLEKKEISTLAFRLEFNREGVGGTQGTLAVYLPPPPTGPAGQLEEPDFGLASTQRPEGEGRGPFPDPRARLRCCGGRENGWPSPEVTRQGQERGCRHAQDPSPTRI